MNFRSHVESLCPRMNDLELKCRFAQGLLWTISATKVKRDGETESQRREREEREIKNGKKPSKITNFVVSPVGLGGVLGSVCSGLWDDSKHELRRCLYARNEDKLHAMYRRIINPEIRAAELQIANRIYAAESIGIKDNLKNLLKVRPSSLVPSGLGDQSPE